MKKIGTWAVSFIPAAVLACFGFYWALSFLNDGPNTQSINPRLIIAFLAAGPVFIVAHSAAYAALLEGNKRWITILSASLIGPATSTFCVFLIVR